MSELPDSWTSTSLQTVANLVTGNTPSPKSPEYYGGNVPFVKPGDLDGVDPIAVTGQQLTELGAQQSRLVRAGATLVSCIGNLGKVGFAGVPLATNQQINSAEFHGEIVDDRYGYYLCKTLKPWMERESSATTIAILNKRKFGEASFPLAPLAEQKRIAAKLDTVLTRVDAVNTRLVRVAPILKRFRQSVLAAATSGRLTEDWRDGHRAADWSHKTVESLCLHISDGPFGSNLKSDDYTNGGARVVRLENIGHLSFQAAKETFISLGKYETLKKHTLLPGDLLFSSFVDEEVRVCEFPANIAEPTINKADCFCVRVDRAQVDPRFLAYRLACKSTYQSLKDLVHGATRPRINLRQLRGFEVMLPSADEQAEIVRRVETLFALSSRLEARLQTAQTATERLTPALLAKAFRGELVPQDPNDEPASELLHRLRQDTQSTSTKRRQKSAA